MMTFAGIAYGEPSAIPGNLQKDELTAGSYSIDWIAKNRVDPDVFAFIAYSLKVKRFVISIRGTYPNPFCRAYWDDANLDTPFGEMVSWPGHPDAKVSAGTWSAFQKLLVLVDAAGESFAAAVRRLRKNADLFVTGHSLGGSRPPASLPPCMRLPA